MRVQRRYGNPSQHRRTATQSPVGQLGWVVCAISPLSATSSTGTRRGKRAGSVQAACSASNSDHESSRTRTQSDEASAKSSRTRTPCRRLRSLLLRTPLPLPATRRTPSRRRDAWRRQRGVGRRGGRCGSRIALSRRSLLPRGAQRRPTLRDQLHPRSLGSLGRLQLGRLVEAVLIASVCLTQERLLRTVLSSAAFTTILRTRAAAPAAPGPIHRRRERCACPRRVRLWSSVRRRSSLLSRSCSDSRR